MHCIDEGQAEQQEDRGHDETEARDDAAERAVEPPAEVDRELQGLRPRQQHAEIERIHERPLFEPAAPFDDLAVHDRDLPCRPAEGDEAELQPEAEGLAASGRA